MIRLQAAVLCVGMLLVGASRVWAATPADRYQVNEAGDFITDTRTGLVWQRTLNAGSFTWSAAKAYCAGLGSGWRLPTRKELLTLVDPTRAAPNPTIDPIFASTPAAQFWTASSYVGQPGNAWVVSFHFGHPYNYGGGDTRVRCVR